MERNGWIRIVVAYEHSDDGMRIGKVMDRIAGKLKADCRINGDLWDFERMADPSLSTGAAMAAKEADLIIIAARNELPIHVQDWLEHWASRERTKPVSIVLWREPEQSLQDLAALLEYMQELAERGGADFFWHNQPSQTEDERSLEKTPWWLDANTLKRRYEVSHHRQ